MKRIYNFLLVFIMFGTDFILLIRSFVFGNYDNLVFLLAFFPILFFPYFFEKIFHKQFDNRFKVVYFSFFFLAYFLGVLFKLYETTSWYALMVHFISGIISCFIAFLLINHFQYKKKAFEVILYALSFTCLVAVCWELFEYGIDSFFGMDLQYVMVSGVRDTMNDLLAAFLGNFMFLICYFFPSKSGRFCHFINSTRIIY